MKKALSLPDSQSSSNITDTSDSNWGEVIVGLIITGFILWLD